MSRPGHPSEGTPIRIRAALLTVALLCPASLGTAIAVAATARAAGKAQAGASKTSTSKGSGSKDGSKGSGSKGSGSKGSGSKGSASELWATVDVCNAPDQPNTFGIRGSMPGNGRAKDEMYMRFQVQYLDESTKQWTDLAEDGNSGWQKLGTAALARQAGRTFQFVPATGAQTFTLRGRVSFQWRDGKKVARTLVRTTTAGHKSGAGADPPGFSAASCPVG